MLKDLLQPPNIKASGPHPHKQRAAINLLVRLVSYSTWLLPAIGSIGLLLLGRDWPWSLMLLLPLLGRLFRTWRMSNFRPAQIGWSTLVVPGLILATATAPGLIVSVDPATSMARVQALVAGLVVYLIALTLRGGERRAVMIALAGGLAVFTLVSLVVVDWRGAALVNIPALYEHLPHLTISVAGSGVPAPKEEVNPRMVGGLLAILLMPATAGWWLTEQRISRVLIGLTILAGLGLVVLSQSLEAWLGIVTGYGIFLLAWQRDQGSRLWRHLLPIAYGLLLLALAVPWVLGALQVPAQTAATLQDNGSVPLRLDARLEIWNRAAQMVADAPLTGAGLNNFPFVFHDCYQGFIMDDRAWMVAVSAHNIYLQTMNDSGLAGLLALLALLVLAFRWWARQGSTMSPSERLISNAALAALAAFLGFNLFDSLTLGAKGGVILWLLLGLLASSSASLPISGPVDLPEAHPGRQLPSKPPGRQSVGWSGGIIQRATLAILAVVSLGIGASWLTGTAVWQTNLAAVAVRRAVAEIRPVGPQRIDPPPVRSIPPAAIATLTRAEASAGPGNSQILYQRGVLAYQFGDYATARRSLEELVAQGRATYAAYYYLGWSQFQLGDPQAAASLIQTGSFDVLLAGGNALASRDPAQAEVVYQAADRRAPGRPEPLLGLARLREQAGDMEGAHAAYTALEHRFPDRADPYLAEAQLFEQAHKPEYALTVLHRAEEQAAKPHWLIAYNLSQIYKDQQDLPQALAYGRQAAAEASTNGVVQAWLGDLYLAQDAYGDAANQYYQLAETSTEPYWQWQGLVRAAPAYQKAGDYAQALSAARAGVTRAGQVAAQLQDQAQAYVVLGDVLNLQGAQQAALDAYHAALQIDPHNIEAQDRVK